MNAWNAEIRKILDFFSAESWSCNCFASAIAVRQQQVQQQLQCQFLFLKQTFSMANFPMRILATQQQRCRHYEKMG
jgi:hypothetical protein